MGVEQEIQQRKPFQNERDRAIVNLLFTHSWLKEKLALHFKSFGITRKQYNILRILNGAEKPLTTSDIRLRMIDKMSDITRLIDRIIKKGLAKKTTRLSDKRLVDIVITERGQQLLANIAKNQFPINSYLQKLSIEEINVLNILLDKIREFPKP